MGATPAGLYLTFFDEGAALSAELPALGPYDDIVIRGARVIGERAQLGEMIAAHAADGRWIGAESAAGRGRADATRSHIRLRADRGGILLRFFTDETTLASGVRQLGPFAWVVVGTHEVRADSKTLAVRVSPAKGWLMTDVVGRQDDGPRDDVIGLVATVAERVSAAPPARRAADLAVPVGRATPEDEQAPSVWVDRVKPASEIYISRPDTKR